MTFSNIFIIFMNVQKVPMCQNSFEKKYKSIKFQRKKLKYSSKLILYDSMVTKFDCKKIVADNEIYIQNLQNSIFLTKDLQDFVFLGNGDIIGILNSSLIVKFGSNYWIYTNGIKISLYFYLENDKIVYKHKKNGNGYEIETECIIYDNFLVVTHKKNALFIDFYDSKDLQCTFSNEIIKYYPISFKKIIFLVFEYEKNNLVQKALFYYNELICTNVYIDYLDKDVNISFNIKPHMANKNNIEDGSVEFINPLDTVKNNRKGSFLLDNVENEKSNGISQYYTTKYDYKVTFDISNIEYNAFLISNIEDRISFLKMSFTGAKFNIIACVADLILHYSNNISLIIDQNQNIYSELIDLSSNSLFYENPDLSILKKMPKFKFKNRLTEMEINFINRKYQRVFLYNPQVNITDNLAYKIIDIEKRFINHNNLGKLFDQCISHDKSFIRIINAHYEDTRIEEIIQILLENKINIQADIADVNNYRQSTFLLRCACNIGSYFMNLNLRYYTNSLNQSIKLNSLSIDEKLPKDLQFNNSACLFSYYKNPELKNIYDQLGYDFGDGLINGLSQEKLDKYLKLVSTVEDNILKFVYIVISTSNINILSGENHNINTLFKSSLENDNIDIKKAGLCSLAIYNLETHDRNILEILIEEINKVGPIKLDRNTAFYNSEYRKLAAICISMVSNHSLLIKTNDSFCELLVNGLSSINSNISPSTFYRTDEYKPDEIFYSVLFQHTCDFSILPKYIVNELDIVLSTSNLITIYSTAAKIFYVSLYYLNNNMKYEDHIYNKIYDFVVLLEDRLLNEQYFQILFNFSIVSLSIMKSATCDIELCRILRRQLLKTKNIEYMNNYSIFDHKKKDLNSFKGFDYESVQFYKMAIGIVCLDFGMSNITQKSIKQLIITFFISNSCFLEFNYIDILRMVLIKTFKTNDKSIDELRSTFVKQYLNKKRKKCVRYFENVFYGLSDIDKKFVIDILSDYYENTFYPGNQEPIFDMKILAKLVSITK